MVYDWKGSGINPSSAGKAPCGEIVKGPTVKKAGGMG